MQKIGFDAEKYIEEQSKYILERINHSGTITVPSPIIRWATMLSL